MPKRQRSPVPSDEDSRSKRVAHSENGEKEQEYTEMDSERDEGCDVAREEAADLLPECDFCMQEPYALKSWLAWLSAVDREALGINEGLGVYERAVGALPGSYKLWRAYAQKARKASLRYAPGHKARKHALEVTLRAARSLQRAPRLWEDALEHCAAEAELVLGRATLNEALRVLPVTQHDRLWNVAREEILALLPPSARASLLERYCKLRPQLGAVELFDARCEAKQWDSAVAGLLRSLDDADWDPPGKRSRDELWVAAVTAAVTNPSAVTSVDVPALLRVALKGDSRLAHGLEAAALHRLLARYHVRAGDFDSARQVYQEAVESTSSVRDFTVLYDAWVKLEEALVNQAMNQLDEAREEGTDVKEEEGQVEKQLERLEKLAERRPFLLSDARLRANPHNVHEWHKRARLHKRANQAGEAVRTYRRAQGAVDAAHATAGKPHTLWLAHAAYLENNEKLTEARAVLEEALEDCARFALPQDAAAVWCEYAEMELRLERPMEALAITKRATVQPDADRRRVALKKPGGVTKGTNGIVASPGSDKQRAWSYWRSGRLWGLHLDLVASLESPDALVEAHHAGLDAGALDAQTVVNGAALLAERAMFEQAFRLLDRATQKLDGPARTYVWACYLSAFTRRHGSEPRRRERARSLWEDAVASFEETLKGAKKRESAGAANDAMVVLAAYARWEPVSAAQRRIWLRLATVGTASGAAGWRFAVARVGTTFGAAAARPVYEAALEDVTVRADAVAMAGRFAKLETALGEADRARALYKHGATAANADGDSAFWKAWADFELAHGNEDAFRDMLRIKRAAELRDSNAHVPMRIGAHV